MAHPTERSTRPPLGLQRHAFFLAPNEYWVVDGDTLSVGTYNEHGARLRFRIRLSSTNAPEMPRPEMTDDFWQKNGIDPNVDCPGARAARILTEAMAGRPILVVPAVQQNSNVIDRFNRLLADVYFSGPNHVPEASSPETKGFDFEGYQNVSRFMFAAGQCRLMPGKSLPSPTNPILEQMKSRIDYEQLAPASFDHYT